MTKPYCSRCRATVDTVSLGRHDAGYHQSSSMVKYSSGGTVRVERNKRDKQFHCRNCDFVSIYPSSLQRHAASSCPGSGGGTQKKGKRTAGELPRSRPMKKQKACTPVGTKTEDTRPEEESSEEESSENEESSGNVESSEDERSSEGVESSSENEESSNNVEEPLDDVGESLEDDEDDGREEVELSGKVDETDAMLDLFSADAPDVPTALIEQEEVSSKGYDSLQCRDAASLVSVGRERDYIDLDGIDLEYPESDDHTSEVNCSISATCSIRKSL